MVTFADSPPLTNPLGAADLDRGRGGRVPGQRRERPGRWRGATGRWCASVMPWLWPSGLGRGVVGDRADLGAQSGPAWPARRPGTRGRRPRRGSAAATWHCSPSAQRGQAGAVGVGGRRRRRRRRRSRRRPGSTAARSRPWPGPRRPPGFAPWTRRLSTASAVTSVSGEVLSAHWASPRASRKKPAGHCCSSRYVVAAAALALPAVVKPAGSERLADRVREVAERAVMSAIRPLGAGGAADRPSSRVTRLTPAEARRRRRRCAGRRPGPSRSAPAYVLLRRRRPHR